MKSGNSPKQKDQIGLPKKTAVTMGLLPQIEGLVLLWSFRWIT
jgi:hypothetical protein